ncbi:MAG TPA: AI-2E family transporter [Candidatus Blautia excrementipullorum]|nr:AI-2E family transporter [Candidatus Blautia excrementipullorum]
MIECLILTKRSGHEVCPIAIRRCLTELDKKNMKNIMLLILFTVLLYVGLQNINVVLDVLASAIGLVFPFILGGGIAFVLNVPMSFIERNLFGKGKAQKSKTAEKLARPLSLILSILLVALIIMIVGFVVIPELGRTAMGLGKGIETGIQNLQRWIDSTFQQNSAIVEWANSLDLQPQKMVDSILQVLRNGVNNILSSTVTVTMGIVNTAANVSIGFVFACYILVQKEKLMVQAKKALFALFPRNAVDYFLHVCTLANNTFSRFVTGQCIEAVILGSMFFVTMTIFKFPYAMLVGVLIAFTALIPIFGAFIGCVISALLILLVSPMKALLFLILFLVLQQIEGNLIYPHVVGGSVGLPSVWVLVAVTVGGSLMGVVGMLIFIPLVSVLYALFREWMYKSLKKKGVRV